MITFTSGYGEHKDWFDLSKFEREELNCKDNDNRLGNFKDELHGMPMTEMLELNPKSYAFRWQKECNNIAETKRAKGVPKATVDKAMGFESYEEVLKKGTLATREVTNVGSFNQQLFTFVTKDLSLKHN